MALKKAAAKSSPRRGAGRSSAAGAGALSIVVPPKLIGALRSRTRPTAQDTKGSEIRETNAYELLNNTQRNYRQATDIVGLLRHLARAEGPFSTAVHNLVEVTNTPHKVTAWNNEQRFDADGTLLAMNLVTQLDTPTEYLGFTRKLSFDMLKTMMLREVVLTGAIYAELGLNDAQMMDLVQVVGAETLRFESDGKGGAVPSQEIAGKNEPVKLDIPTFFGAQMHADPGSVNPRSMMESALKMLLYFEELLEDIRRVVRQSGHNRLVVKLNAEKLKAITPREVTSDTTKWLNYMELVRSTIQSQLESLEPEQALVMFDSVDADVVQSGTGTKVDYTPLLQLAVGQYATGMKTPPSVLGLRMEGGGSATGSIETMMFLKSARAIQKPVETVMSRILTLAARVMGADVTVSFEFTALDLRPDNEQQAFHAMRAKQIYEKLSLGLISDDEAAHELGAFPRPVGAPDLSGTMFMNGGAASDEAEEMPTRPGETPLGRTMQPPKDAPRKSGGKDQ